MNMYYLISLRSLYEMNALYSPADLIDLLDNPTAAQGAIDQLKGLWGIATGSEEVRVLQSGAYAGETTTFQKALKLTPVRHYYEWSKLDDISDKENFMLKSIGKTYKTVKNMDAFRSTKDIRDEEKRKLKEERGEAKRNYLKEMEKYK